MPIDESAAVLVARFLRTNGYEETLDAFLKEAGLPSDTGQVSKDALTIERVLSEKRTYDLSVRFEKLGQDDSTNWSVPAPSISNAVSLPSAANVLQATVETLRLAPSGRADQVLLVTTADRRLSFIRVDLLDSTPLRSISNAQDSPILSYTILWNRFIAFTSISGKLAVYDALLDEVITQRKDHSKYGVHVVSHLVGNSYIIATAGWDSKVFLYSVEASDDSICLPAPFAFIHLSSLPESILFARCTDYDTLYLLCARRDSSVLYYYRVAAGCTTRSLQELTLSGEQNLSPYSTSWVAFSPSAISLCPTDPGLIAVATSSMPHMKVLIVRLLFPHAGGKAIQNEEEATVTASPPSSHHRGTQIDARETAAVLVHCNTMTAQTQYSTPVIVWRADGSGVWVNSEDGMIKGIETSTGKITARLQGHEVGSKVRCLWAGRIGAQGGGAEEWLVSGGFDQRLVVWKPEGRPTT